MEFSFDKFYQLNRRIFIWGLLFLVVWLLRDFFGLIFLTFVLSFISQPMVQFGQARMHLPRRAAIVIVYLFFLFTIVSVITLITPRVVHEAAQMSGNLPNLKSRIVDLKSDLVGRYPALEEAIPGYLASGLSEGGGDNPAAKDYRQEFNAKREKLRDSIGLTETDLLTRDSISTTDTQRRALIATYERGRDELLINTFLAQQLELLSTRLPIVFKAIYQGSVTLLLALLFSFLIDMDIYRLGNEVASLSNSRLADFYNQTAQPVVRFAYVVGQAIRAQTMIALANTLMTVIGLYFLNIPSLVMLSFIVFFCSFIPVLGVFISTIPIILMALNSGGFSSAIGAVVMVVIIHAVDAYPLYPLIYGQHFKINPVIILMILFIAHHAFGIWGMILGVPVAYYFIHDVIGVPVWGEKRLAAVERKPPGAATPLSAMPRAEIDPDEAAAVVPHGDAARTDEAARHNE